MIEKFNLKSVRQHREEFNLTQQQLALKSRVPQETISMIETGTRHMLSDVAIKLAKIFKVEPFLLKLAQEMEKNGIILEQRHVALKSVLDNQELSSATKSLIETERLDFGNRDGFGRKRSKSFDFSLKEQEKEKRDRFGIVRKGEDPEVRRDSFGVVRKVEDPGSEEIIDPVEKQDTDLANKKKKELLKVRRRDKIKEMLKSLKSADDMVEEDKLIYKIAQLVDKEAEIVKKG